MKTTGTITLATGSEASVDIRRVEGNRVFVHAYQDNILDGLRLSLWADWIPASRIH